MTALAGTDALAIGPATWAGMSPFASLLTVIGVHETPASPSIVLIARAQAPEAPAADYLCALIRVAAGAMSKRSQ